MSATTPPPTRATVPQVRRPADDLSVRAVRSVPAARGRGPHHGPQADRALLPNLLVPGVAHAGAALLTADLARHPELCLPDDRCPGLFHGLRYGRPVDVRPHDYDRHYARWAGQRYRVETSPDYLGGGRPMAQALADRLPDLRVIVLLRDPAQRLWSGYTEQLARRRLPRAMGFDAFVDRCLALRANGADCFEGNRHFRTLSGGYYIDTLPDWFDVFGDRVRIAFTEHLQEDPAEQLCSLLAWLDLDPDLVSSVTDGGYPVAEPAPAGFNRLFRPARGGWWAPSAWSASASATYGVPVRTPRQTDRARMRVRSLYAVANAELAGLLRDRGMTCLPAWLAESKV
jgi:hypothetical protein